MRFAVLIALVALNLAAFAATNATVAVCATATNATPVKVLGKAPKLSRQQCEAMTLAGNRCKRHAVGGSKYCSQHAAILRKREKGNVEKTEK